MKVRDVLNSDSMLNYRRARDLAKAADVYDRVVQEEWVIFDTVRSKAM